MEHLMRALRLITILAALAPGAAAHADGGFGPAAVPPAARSFHVGALELTALHDAAYVVPNDGKTFGVDAGTTVVSDLLRTAGAPTDRISLSVNALLVKIGARVFLLDTGLGPKLHGGLIGSLKQAGIAPDRVTDVLLTHSHGDHVGGLVDAEGRPAFPKATIRMAGAEWAWLQQQGPAELVKAIGGHVATFEPGALIAPGLKSVALDGHTPGHVGFEVSSGQARLLDIGDMAHSAILSLAKPEWAMGFDNNSALAKATRMHTLASLASEGELVFSPHFPFPGVGRVVVRGSAFEWKADVPE